MFCKIILNSQVIVKSCMLSNEKHFIFLNLINPKHKKNKIGNETLNYHRPGLYFCSTEGKGRILREVSVIKNPKTIQMLHESFVKDMKKCF